LVSQSKQPQRIIAILKKCLPASAARADVLACLLEMLARSNRYPEILQACQSILEIDPEFFPAVETIRSLRNNPAAKQALANVTLPGTPSLSEEYDWFVASNVTDALIGIMSKFYAMAGVDPQTAPLVQGLERSRRKLEAVRPQIERVADQSTLVLFELAWKSHCAGETKKALAAFEKIFSDRKLHLRGTFNPFAKEAVVRAGEILGRHYDTLGDVEKAIGIYREVLSVDPNSLIARRLIVLLSRSGRLNQAVEFAETAIASRPNLFRNIPPNQHIVALKAELYLTPEGA
jgi:tetratricopeptide (TPR) repeat protein